MQYMRRCISTDWAKTNKYWVLFIDDDELTLRSKRKLQRDGWVQSSYTQEIGTGWIGVWTKAKTTRFTLLHEIPQPGTSEETPNAG